MARGGGLSVPKGLSVGSESLDFLCFAGYVLYDCLCWCMQEKKKDEKWDPLTHKKEQEKIVIQEKEISAFTVIFF